MENKTLKKRKKSKVRQVISHKTVYECKSFYPIEQLCKALNISKSSYYKWLNQTIPSLKPENEKLKEKIIRIYNLSGGTYGYRNIYLRLFIDFQVNQKRVQPIIQKYNIKPLIRQKRRSIFVAHLKIQL